MGKTCSECDKPAQYAVDRRKHVAPGGIRTWTSYRCREHVGKSWVHPDHNSNGYFQEHRKVRKYGKSDEWVEKHPIAFLLLFMLTFFLVSAAALWGFAMIIGGS